MHAHPHHARGAHADVGRAAVELLLNSMEQSREQALELTVPSELILRRSTGSARTGDLSDR